MSHARIQCQSVEFIASAYLFTGHTYKIPLYSRNVSFCFVYNVRQSDIQTSVQVGVLHQAGLLSQPGNF